VTFQAQAIPIAGIILTTLSFGDQRFLQIEFRLFHTGSLELLKLQARFGWSTQTPEQVGVLQSRSWVRIGIAAQPLQNTSGFA
jgi:hypothetical protein